MNASATPSGTALPAWPVETRNTVTSTRLTAAAQVQPASPVHEPSSRWRRPRKQMQETAFLVQLLLKLRFLVLDFGV
eukprot:3941967-Rhodomonas_salina.8